MNRICVLNTMRHLNRTRGYKSPPLCKCHALNNLLYKMRRQQLRYRRHYAY
jgi:hypothetical protein